MLLLLLRWLRLLWHHLRLRLLWEKLLV